MKSKNEKKSQKVEAKFGTGLQIVPFRACFLYHLTDKKKGDLPQCDIFIKILIYCWWNKHQLYFKSEDDGV